MARGSILSWLTLAILASSALVFPACAEPSSDDPDEKVGTSSSAVTVSTFDWIDVPGSKCGDGSQTGFAISRPTTTPASDVLIFMSGGGLCLDSDTCAGTSPVFFLRAAHFRDGYNASTLASDATAGWFPKGILSRDSANPFKNSTLVYIPYCTGDFHTGNDDTTKSTWAWGTGHFAGRKNLEKFIPMIKSLVPTASRITLSGVSAGGFGALFNYDFVATSFKPTRVDLVTDAAPLWDNFSWPQAWPVWGTNAILPVGCTDCASSKMALYRHLSMKYPAARFAFSSRDTDIAVGPGLYGMLPTPNFYNQLQSFSFGSLRSNPNWRYFAPSGTTHGMLDQSDGLTTGSDKLSYGAWLAQMRSDSTAWSDVASWGTSCPTGSGRVVGDIEKKYLALGGCGSAGGAPISNELVLPDMSGRASGFANNSSIYWHPSVGPHEIHGAIRQYWADRGWELSGWGYPTSDEIAITSGKKQVFQNGGVYSSAATSIHGVLGGIYARYAAIGAEASALGLPTSEEFATGPFNADRRQNFQRGYIYFSQLGGPSVVYY